MMTDHQRADSLGMVQAGREVTPHLNRLASSGTNFQRCYDACPLCVPARTALATGKTPTHNGITTNDWAGKTAGDHKPVHQLLKEQGYRVAHIGVDHIKLNPSLRERMNFDTWTGKETYADYLQEKGLKAPESGPEFRKPILENQQGEKVACNYSSPHCDLWPGDTEDFMDLFWCREAGNFIEAQDPRPFALFLYLWAPHPPLQVPEPYASLFPPEQIDLPDNIGRANAKEPACYREGIAAQLAEGESEADWRKVWAAHLGLVHLADAGMGEILTRLHARGLQEETLVVFTSDHGDHLGQHNMYQKMEMYEQAIHVPMIWSGPEIQHHKIGTPVSHLDVLPTLIETLGLENPGNLDGRSLSSALAGNGLSPQPVFSQYSGNPVIGDLRRAVIDGNLKYVWSPGGQCELFDLEADPLEQNNLQGQSAYEAEEIRLRTLCKNWAEAHGDFIHIEVPESPSSPHQGPAS